MASISRSIRIDRPAQAAFDVLADLSRLPHLSGLTVSVNGDPGRPIQTGDRFEQVVRIVGKELDTEWQVVAVEPPRRIECEGTAPGGGRAHLVERIEGDGSTCEVTLEVDYDLPGGFLGDVVDALFVERRNEREAETILANLKDLVEGRPVA